MHAARDTSRDETTATCVVDFSRNPEPITGRIRFTERRHWGLAPTLSSGRGAKIQDLRLFVGMLAFLAASVASTATAVTFDMATIGNPGNAGFYSNDIGGVAYTYALSRYETTNVQYVEFLNAVGASNPNAIYNPLMGSDANGGIIQAGASGSFTYSVKGGANPTGTSYGNVPINFVDWFDVARFANWMHGGQSANPADLEIGSYTLANATSGPIASRNVGATFVIPSSNEWAKAGFNNGGLTNNDYTIYATNNDSKPTSDFVTPSNVNVANYGGAALSAMGPLEVGSYTNSQSYYGLYEMMGNIAEMTETAKNDDSSQWAAMSGSFSTQEVALDQFNIGSLHSVYVNSTHSTAQIGFRMANIQPVPEPATIAIAGAGLAGLIGLGCKRRRTGNVSPAKA